MSHIIGDITSGGGTFAAGTFPFRCKCPYGCAEGHCDGTVISGDSAAAAAQAAGFSAGAVTYEVTYDVYGPAGPEQTTATVTATGLDMGDRYVTLSRDGKAVFSVHRDRFATIRQVDAAQAIRRDDAAIEAVADRVEALLLRRLNSAALGR